MERNAQSPRDCFSLRLSEIRHRAQRRARAWPHRRARRAPAALARASADAPDLASRGAGARRAVHGGGGGPARLWRLRPPRGRCRPRGLQQARNGARCTRRHAPSRLRALRRAGARPRRARRASAGRRPCGGRRPHAAAGHRTHALDVREHHRGLCARLLALVLPDPAAAAARGLDRLRPGALRAQRDGRAPRGARAFRARGAGRIRALRRHSGHGRIDLRRLPRVRHHRSGARPRRHRRRPQACAAAARALGRARRGGPLLRCALALARMRRPGFGPRLAVRPLHTGGGPGRTARRGAPVFHFPLQQEGTRP